MTWRQKLPNQLTFTRIAAIPLLVVVFYLPGNWGYWGCWTLFTYAGITDYFDGHLARKWNIQSPLGAFLDPIADKLLVAAAILLLVSEARVDVLPALVILCRELLISGLREFLADKKITMPVSFLAKIKTTTQMIAIGGLLVAPGTPDWWHFQFLSNALFWISALITIRTGYVYVKEGLKHL
jgi:cardiolipin synthase